MGHRPEKTSFEKMLEAELEQKNKSQNKILQMRRMSSPTQNFGMDKLTKIIPEKNVHTTTKANFSVPKKTEKSVIHTSKYNDPVKKKTENKKKNHWGWTCLYIDSNRM